MTTAQPSVLRLAVNIISRFETILALSLLDNTGEFLNLQHPVPYEDTLIYDKIYIDDFGECLGMGKCGTCLVEIIKSNPRLAFYERNEKATLLKSGHSGKNVHLSCQIMIDEFINGLQINVL